MGGGWSLASFACLPLMKGKAAQETELRPMLEPNGRVGTEIRYKLAISMTSPTNALRTAPTAP